MDYTERDEITDQIDSLIEERNHLGLQRDFCRGMNDHMSAEQLDYDIDSINHQISQLRQSRSIL